MPFIQSYNGAMQLLASIENGTCSGRCKTDWIRNFKYALKTKTNPLGLNLAQRRKLTEKIKHVSGRNPSRTTQKYRTRNSPPYPANENCGKTMKGNDGNMYISKPNKNNICSWKKE